MKRHDAANGQVRWENPVFSVRALPAGRSGIRCSLSEDRPPGLDTTGSVRVVFDAAGSVLTRVDYGPLGEQLAAAPGAPNDKYAGLFRDDETGLDYAQARQYNPRTWRFTSLDPVYSGLFEPQRWNRYAYALNSPLTFVDPEGLQIQSHSTPGCVTCPKECQGAVWDEDLWFFYGGGYGRGRTGGGGNGRGRTGGGLESPDVVEIR